MRVEPSAACLLEAGGAFSVCVCAASRRRIVFHAALAREVGMRERTGERGTCGCLDLVDVVFSAGAVCNFVCILHLVWSRVCCLKCWSTLSLWLDGQTQ